MARERQEEERAGAAFEATISESESDESTRDEDGSEAMEIPVKPGHENVQDAVPQISSEDMNQNREDFSSLMRVGPTSSWPNKQITFQSGKDEYCNIIYLLDSIPVVCSMYLPFLSPSPKFICKCLLLTNSRTYYTAKDDENLAVGGKVNGAILPLLALAEIKSHLQ